MEGNEILTLTIESLSYGVFGVARTERGVVLVPGTAPGDVVRARVVGEHGNYREAELVDVLTPSAERRAAPCRYLPECGGCPWQHVEYGAQLAAKEAALRDALVRTGGIRSEELDVRPILPSPEWAYRHRVSLRVDGEQRLGFFRHRSHRLVEIEECLIADETVNRHLAVAREWLRGMSTAVKRLEIANAGSGEAVFVANADGPFRHDEAYHEGFLRAHRTVGGILLHGKGWRRSFGDPRVVLEVPGLVLESRGFTQVNPTGNEQLVRTMLALAAPGADDRALDLFCGAGNLTLPLAQRAAAVVGVEVDSSSLEDARRNADRAGLRNCRFILGEAARAAQSLAAENERFDLVVLDPPRSGAAAVLDHLPKLGARRIIYVSCNPATFARDVRTLAPLGYRLGEVQPIDLFPQTYHLETVALLRRDA